MMKRSIWKSGSSYVVPLPPKWLRRIIDRRMDIRRIEDIEVYLHEIDKSTVRISVKEEQELEIPSFPCVDDDPVKIETWVYGAYMMGYDEVKLLVPLEFEKTREIIDRVPSLLYGTHCYISDEDASRFSLRFNDEIIKEKNIMTVLEKCSNKISQMYEKNYSSIESFPNETTIKEATMLINTYEPELDKTSFRMKRLLNKSLFDPMLFRELGLVVRKHIILYSTIVDNVERIGDLHQEISVVLNQLKDLEVETHSGLSLKPLLKYLRVSHESVDLAFKILQMEKITETLEPRHSMVDEETNIGYIPGRYEKEDARKLAKYIDKCPSECIRFLTLLTSKIWGIRGNAYNAIEAKLNMLY
ncbi:MAG: hypothetical protein NWE91_02835 [Candidatus Bathyarchaeota archaeon]|nr:hypothetical protein [Candidatus Bathyarchaeota archaeon]